MPLPLRSLTSCHPFSESSLTSTSALIRCSLPYSQSRRAQCPFLSTFPFFRPSPPVSFVYFSSNHLLLFSRLPAVSWRRFRPFCYYQPRPLPPSNSLPPSLPTSLLCSSHFGCDDSIDQLHRSCHPTSLCLNCLSLSPWSSGRGSGWVPCHSLTGQFGNAHNCTILKLPLPITSLLFQEATPPTVPPQ